MNSWKSLFCGGTMGVGIESEAGDCRASSGSGDIKHLIADILWQIRGIITIKTEPRLKPE